MTKITKPNKSQGSARACFYMYVLCADLCLLSAEVGRRCHAQGPACTWGTYSVVSYNLVFSKKKKLYIHDFFFLRETWRGCDFPSVFNASLLFVEDERRVNSKSTRTVKHCGRTLMVWGRGRGGGYSPKVLF